MCRFFAMWHYKHPAVRPYDYIFRLDDGIRFHCELVRVACCTPVQCTHLTNLLCSKKTLSRLCVGLQLAVLKLC